MVDPGRSQRAVYLHTWSSRMRQYAPRLLRLLTLVLVVAIFAPVQAAGRPNVDLDFTNDPPLGGYQLGDFDGDGKTDLFRVSGGNQWQYSSGGTGAWINLASETLNQNELRFGDFNGDDKTDVFHVSGNQWRYRPSGIDPWVLLASDTTPYFDLRFGYFDNDNKTDVFSVVTTPGPELGRWRYSSGGVGSYIPLAIEPSLTVNQLRFGDFNGDDITDVFSVDGAGDWRFSSGGAQPWDYSLAAEPSLTINDLYLGDFDGNGITDIFNREGTGQWRFSKDGVQGWAALWGDASVAIADMRFGDFDGDSKTDVFNVGPGNQARFSSGAVVAWQNLTPALPVPVTPLPPGPPITAITSLAFGDFNGDGITDVFRTNGGQWQYSPGGVDQWVNLAFDPLPLDQLRFHDFNGDGRTDVFSVDGSGQWRWSNAGVTSWQNLASEPGVPITELRFGTWDIPANNIYGVFSREASGQWRYRSGGLGAWNLLAMDPLPLLDLGFDPDFDGDGVTDIFSIDPVDLRGRYSPQSRQNWVALDVQNIPLSLIRFGDFNGDGKSDIFTRTDTGQWRYLSGGLLPWIDGATDPLSINDLRFGDFNGDGRTDVFSIGPDGRWRYSSAAVSSWILLGPPTPVTPVTPVTPTTPTVTPIPSPTPMGCFDILVNGGFETNEAWHFGDSPVPGKYTGAQKQSGLRSVQLGITPEIANVQSYSSIRQAVMVPQNALTVTLRWWQWAFSDEGSNPNPTSNQDRLDVIALAPNGDPIRIIQRTRQNNSAWTSVMVDVTELAGKNIYIYFNLYNDGHGGRSWIYLDTMMMEVCPGSGNMNGGGGMPPWGGGGGGGGMGPKDPWGHPGKGGWMPMTPTPTITPTVPVTPGADLSLTKNVVPLQVIPGEVFTYTLTVNNAGPETATGIMVLDNLPPNIIFGGASGDGSYSDMTGFWTVGSLTSGASASLIITAVADVDASGFITNVAQVWMSTPDDPDSTPGNYPPTNEDDNATAVIFVGPPDDYVELAITKDVTPTEVMSGTLITYTIVVTNSGPQIAMNVAVSDTLPEGVTFGGASGDGNYNPDPDMNPGTSTGLWTISAITDSARLIITATVNASATATMENIAEIMNSTPPDIDPSDNRASATISLPTTAMADLAITKAVTPTSVATGQYITYTITVVNNGPSPATGIIISDTLPTELSNISDNGNGNFASGIWTVSSLPVGMSATLIISGSVESPGSITNVATITSSSPIDLNPLNNTASAVFTATGDIVNDLLAPALGSAPAFDMECVELIRDGNFEGDVSAWTVLQGPAAPTLTSEQTFNGSPQAMLLGLLDGDNLASISSISQMVQLPSETDSIVLSFRYYPLFENQPGPGDLQYADIYNVMTGQFAGRALGTQTNDRTWLTADYDMTMQAGQEIRLVLAVNNDGVEGRSAMFVDNVSIMSCTFGDLLAPGAAPTPDPALGVSNRQVADQSPVLLAGRESPEATNWLARLSAMGVFASVAGVIAFVVMVVIGTLRRPI